jgi:hypothetical protein
MYQLWLACLAWLGGLHRLRYGAVASRAAAAAAVGLCAGCICPLVEVPLGIAGLVAVVRAGAGTW